MTTTFTTTTTADTKAAGVSIADLNLTKQCESAYEFEYLDPKGNPTGVFLTVLGSQSATVKNWERKTLNAARARTAMQIKRGKDVENRVEDDEEFGNDAAVVRIVGWRGITEPFSPGLALTLVENNSELRAQVFKASNDLANFTRG